MIKVKVGPGALKGAPMMHCGSAPYCTRALAESEVIKNGERVCE